MRKTTGPAFLPPVAVHPLTPDRWPDLEALFGARGAYAGCWCMWWRLPRAEWAAGRGEGNRRALRAVVAAGPPPGLLAYAEGRPVGWVAVTPRRAIPRLDASRLFAPVDARPAWAITCFYVAPGWRRRGLLARLLAAAVEHARAGGARLLEACPVDTAVRGRIATASGYTGVASVFRRAGFREVLRRAPDRPLVRLALRPARAAAPAGARGRARAAAGPRRERRGT